MLKKCREVGDAAAWLPVEQVLNCWQAGFLLTSGGSEADIEALLGESPFDNSGDMFAKGLTPLAKTALQMQEQSPLSVDEFQQLRQTNSQGELQNLIWELLGRRRPKYLLGWRDITNATNERTVIAGMVPLSGVGNNMPLIVNDSKISTKIWACLFANLNSLPFDFVARHKVGGTHLNFFIIKQLPVLGPDNFTEDKIEFIVPRVLELTYTACDLKPFAEDLDYHGEPFKFDPVRRHQLKSELDAYYAKLYGLTRDELCYILDPADVMGEDYPSETFRVLKNKELKEFGEYRTRRLVLEAWDKLEAGTLETAPVELGVIDSDEAEVVVNTQNLPDNDWQRPRVDLQAETALQLAAILRELKFNFSIRSARLALLLAMEPRLLMPLLEPEQQAEWLRLNGSDAAPLANGVTRLQPGAQRHWGEAIRQLRASGLLIEDLQERTWSPGEGLNEFPTQAWAEGRAGFVMAWLNSGITVVDVVSELPQELRGWLDENVA